MMIMQPLNAISKCRICDSDKLEPIFSLGTQAASDFVDAKNKSVINCPLELVQCQTCSLVQLRHTVDREALYRHYYYRSGTNELMRAALKDIVQSVMKRIALKPWDIWVDVGSNDATLLKLIPEDYVRIGFEPASNFSKDYGVGMVFVNDFFTADTFNVLTPVTKKRAKVVTAIACFYDLVDPHKFVQDVKNILAEDGLFIIQQNYLGTMLANNAYDNICVKPETIILGDNKRIDEMKSGDLTFGYHGLLSRVVRTMKRQYDGDMIHIRPMYLDSLDCTPEHPLFIVKKENVRFDCGQTRPHQSFKPEWVNAKYVKRGDYVVMPKLKEHSAQDLDLMPYKSKDRHSTKGLLSFPINVDTAWLLGLYVAEGCTGGRPNNPYTQFSLNKKEQEFANHIKTVMKSLGYSAPICAIKGNGMEVRFVCATLSRALPIWCGKYAKNKHIPDFIMNAEREIKQAFLLGLFDGDGYVKKERVYLHTASKILALQVQLMASSLGGMLNIVYAKPSDHSMKNGNVIHGGESWQVRGTCKEILGYPKTRRIEHHHSDENFSYVPVKDVKTFHYSGSVHNVETTSNTYLVSNAIVHNCHEHLQYYSLKSLKSLLEAHGLEIVDVELNDVNGGSFRTYVQHKNQSLVDKTVRNLEKHEERTLSMLEMLAFVGRIEDGKEKLVKFLEKCKSKNWKVYGYGASNRGNTILQYCSINGQLLTAIADRNPEKWGKRTVATDIPIVSEEVMRKAKPKYLLILPYFYLRAFMSREIDFLKNGGTFIIPLPSPKLIHFKNGRAQLEMI